MSDTYCSAEDINKIIELLPLRVTRHMTRVGRIVNLLAHKIQDCDLSISCSGRTEFSYYGDAAFFHDIGKAYIPISILAKSGTFTDNEFETMKKHTVCAQVIFKDISRGLIVGVPEHLIGLAHDAAVYHHEWWNGRGYPYGMCYENIPLVARITSVCDAYDAITNDRVYQAARPHSEACRELEACSGTQFDPVVIKVFIDNEAEIFDVINPCN